MPESAPPSKKLIATCTLAPWLTVAAVSAGGATLARADQAGSGQGLGSIDEYQQTAPRPEVGYESPLLGIEVKNETEWFGRSRSFGYARWVSGVRILRVIPGSPGETAGLRDSRMQVLRSTILVTGFVAAAFFPPAMMGVIALSKATEPHAMIIAVDGKRTCDVIDFEEAVEKAEAGEVVYLTVVSHGRREQIRLALPVR
jgi:S1-C subfamily serine protease